jgi:hypothetical protein
MMRFVSWFPSAFCGSMMYYILKFGKLEVWFDIFCSDNQGAMSYLAKIGTIPFSLNLCPIQVRHTLQKKQAAHIIQYPSQRVRCATWWTVCVTVLANLVLQQTFLDKRINGRDWCVEELPKCPQNCAALAEYHQVLEHIRYADQDSENFPYKPQEFSISLHCLVPSAVGKRGNE